MERGARGAGRAFPHVIGDAFKAVFWSFFGVRKRSEYEADTKRLTPGQVIAAGIVSVAAFVLVLLLVVWLVTRNA